MTIRRPAAAALLLVAGAALSACEGSSFFYAGADNETVGDPDYAVGKPVAGADIDALWDRAQQVLATQGYAVDGTRTRFADRVIVTRWNTLLSPVRFEGVRTRAWVRFGQAPEGGWIVRVAVQKQRNADIDQPSNELVAKWEAQPADSARAGVLLWQIESGFETGEGG